ncbi:hypothetical protein SO802_014010 [Lithocarpus litseifolius]|uniref:Uncharacterized protein n=1 Tax=Lithocarpus litseifolius TaxID=425828 RepID=A0AAW2D836_9ROSI
MNKNTEALALSLHSHWQTTKSLTSLFTLTGKPLARTLCTATETRTQKLEQIADEIPRPHQARTLRLLRPLEAQDGPQQVRPSNLQARPVPGFRIRSRVQRGGQSR